MVIIIVLFVISSSKNTVFCHQQNHTYNHQPIFILTFFRTKGYIGMPGGDCYNVVSSDFLGKVCIPGIPLSSSTFTYPPLGSEVTATPVWHCPGSGTDAAVSILAVQGHNLTPVTGHYIHANALSLSIQFIYLSI